MWSRLVQLFVPFQDTETSVRMKIGRALCTLDSHRDSREPRNCLVIPDVSVPKHLEESSKQQPMCTDRNSVQLRSLSSQKILPLGTWISEMYMPY